MCVSECLCVKGNTFFADFLAIFKNSVKAIQEVKKNWVKPTEMQMQELEFLQNNANKAKVKWCFYKQYKQIKGVVFEAMIPEAVTLKIEHGFVEWFELPGLPSPAQILSHQIEKEVPISASILKYPNRMTWIPKTSKKFLTVNSKFCEFAKLGCKGLSSSLGNQMEIQTAETTVLSISYWLVLSIPIIISDKKTQLIISSGKKKKEN